MSTATLTRTSTATVERDENWRFEASCATRQFQFLFIHPLHDYDGTSETRMRDPYTGKLMSHAKMTAAKKALEVEARKVCHSCPVIDSCLSFSLEKDVSGIAGGLTEDQRAAIREAEGMDVPPSTLDDFTGASWNGNSLNDERIRELSAAGWSAAAIAKEVGCQKRSVYRSRARIRDAS